MQYPSFSSLLSLSLLSELNANCPDSGLIDGQPCFAISDIHISITTSKSSNPPIPLPPPTANTTQSQFLLQINTSGSRPSRLGQVSSYVFSQGTLTTCQFASAFTLVGSQLYADGQLVSTSIDTPSGPLVTSYSTDSIIDGFSLVDGTLEWSNPAFSTNSATFCLTTSNTVVVVSDPSATPSGCISISLEQVPYTQCFPIISVIGSTPLIRPSDNQGSTSTGGVTKTTGVPSATRVNSATGATGTQGAAGGQSLNGADGQPGASGIPGGSGINGANGINGEDSSTGATGTAGADGTSGEDGATGDIGPAGRNGTNGADGATGDIGPAGEDGTNGAVGGTGAPGVNGTNGANGADGGTGPAGPTGTQGPSGADGRNGTDGATGPTGATGPAGPAGSGDGASAGYTVNYGYIGCFVSNPDGTFGLDPRSAQEIVTTSVDDCASLCASQIGGSLYFTLGTTTAGDSICTCGSTLVARIYPSIGLNFQCNYPCVFPDGVNNGTQYCGGYYGEDPLVSVFGAI